MKLSDVAIGIVLAVAGTVVALEAQTFPAVPGQPYGSTFFPALIGLAMAICGLSLAVRAIVKGEVRPWIGLPDWLRAPRGLTSFLLVLVAMGFYMAAADRLGFCVTAFVVLLGLQVWMRARMIPAAAIAFAATAVFYIVFGLLLRVPLPYGLIEQLIR